jgi:NAD(P)H-hydrate repair Nnr-like enzyme with NAD(P)H-hydrate epimerase domain
MSSSAACLMTASIGLLALFLAGCGGTVIDQVKAEDTIQASLEKSLHEKIKAVDCPAGLNVDPGTTFTCAVDRSNGIQATVTLKIRDKEADLSIVDFKPSE